MIRRLKYSLSVFLLLLLFYLESCGPVVFSSRFGTPPPPWFYPNRIETVRYIYFPDHVMYYDLSIGMYNYLENGVWVSVRLLPERFNGYKLRHSNQKRITNYHGDNIKKFHRETTLRQDKRNKNRYR